MRIFRKMIFIFGLILSIISIHALTSYREPNKEKEIGKDY